MWMIVLKRIHAEMEGAVLMTCFPTIVTAAIHSTMKESTVRVRTCVEMLSLWLYFFSFFPYTILFNAVIFSLVHK